MKDFINNKNMIKIITKPQPGFESRYYLYNANSGQIQPDRQVTLEGLYQYLCSEELTSRSAGCYEAYGNLIDSIVDYRGNCSEIPLFEHMSDDALIGIARLNEDYKSHCEELCKTSNNSDKALRIRNAAEKAFTMSRCCLPRVRTTFDEDAIIAAEWRPVGNVNYNYFAAQFLPEPRPTLICSTGGSNTILAFYKISLGRVDVGNWAIFARQLGIWLSSQSYEVLVQPKPVFDYMIWDGGVVQYDADAPAIEAAELTKRGSGVKGLSPQAALRGSVAEEDRTIINITPRSQNATMAENQSVSTDMSLNVEECGLPPEVQEGTANDNFEGIGKTVAAGSAVGLGLDEFDVEDLASHHAPSEANFVAKEWLKLGLLEDYPLQKDLVSAAQTELTADIVFDGSLAMLSSVLSSALVEDDDSLYNLNLAMFITGKSTTRKGRMTKVLPLIEGIDRIYEEELDAAWQEYEKSMSKYKNLEKKGQAPEHYPEEPKVHRLFVHSGDTNGATVIDWLEATDGEGILTTTEVDDLKKSISGRFGGPLASNLRKVTQNEEVMSDRKKGRSRCKRPRASLWLGGIPEHFRDLFGSTIDGFFGRFTCLVLPGTDEFRSDLGSDPRKSRGKTISDVTQYYELFVTSVYKAIHARIAPLRVDIPPTWNSEYEIFMDDLLKVHLSRYGDFFAPTIKRYTLLIKREAAIFALSKKIFEPDWFSHVTEVEVTKQDLQMAIRHVLNRHYSLVQFAHICYGMELRSRERNSSPDGDEQMLHEFAEGSFSVESVKKFISDSSGGALSPDAIAKRAQRWLQRMEKGKKIEKVRHGVYRKVVH